ncbi:MAG: MarR family transcriptional regulator [Proteobacteria bacterium]|nr:MAG: MarR family transcriptional regulator [Pseudomonadota bacterium]
MKSEKRTSAGKGLVPVERGMLEDLVGYHVRKAQAIIFDDFMRAMAPERLSPGQFGVLVMISANQGMNQSTLAKALGIERSTMVAVITGLEKRGLIKRLPLATDRRANILALTPKGDLLLDKVKAKVRAHENKVTARLTADETQTLVSLLQKIGG